MLRATKSFQKFPLSNRYGSMQFKRAKIVECRPKNSYHIFIRFEDGLSGEVDLNYLVGKGVFKDAWRTQSMFYQAKISPETSTITWGSDEDEVDLDPYVLREKIIQ